MFIRIYFKLLLISALLPVASLAPAQIIYFYPVPENCIDYAAEQYDIPPAVLHGIAHVETKHGRYPRNISTAGARGLMQIMAATAKGECGLEYHQLDDPLLSSLCSAKYLRKLWKTTGKLKLAVMAYNIGQGNLRRGKYLKSGRKYLSLVISYARSRAV